jgi:hypothetical protein
MYPPIFGQMQEFTRHLTMFIAKREMVFPRHWQINPVNTKKQSHFTRYQTNNRIHIHTLLPMPTHYEGFSAFQRPNLLPQPL